MSDQKFMKLAINEAKASFPDVPVGAVLVNSSGKMIAKAHNLREKNIDPSGHAEIAVLREAAKDLGTWKLNGCTLFVTFEPCAMCATAISDARISRVVFGAWDQSLGAAGSRYDILRDSSHGGAIEVVGGVLEQECSNLLSEFFRDRRP